jgi:sensor histidine kinase YesM
MAEIGALTAWGFSLTMGFMLSPKSGPPHRSSGFWRINVLICTALGVLSFCSRYYLNEGLERSLLVALTAGIISFCLTSLLRTAYLKNAKEPGPKVSFLAKMLALTLAAGFIHGLILQVIVSLMDRTSMLDWRSSQWSFSERLYLSVLLMWVLYLGWSFGYFWIRAELQVREEILLEARIRAEAQRMELQLLRFQLDPHFLFNTLNGIISEIPSDPNAAMEMVSELSSYLKYSLDHRSQLVTRLSSELDATGAYLRIQKARFGDRMQADIKATQTARATMVPSFILQPLVENAFKHGFSLMTQPWSLEINAETHGDHLVIKVRNAGKLAPSQEACGVGLETIKGRLSIHYPNRHSFQIREEDGFVVATIDLEGAPCNV